ncbi:hypothetical protein R1sor_014098 [Riccia sorocarpa]|uniref:F-box domain-containing protein n=1 Tax=Riccia sorocarpa TaxID=122646 RepID=A0ABD3HCA5_9MARC
MPQCAARRSSAQRKNLAIIRVIDADDSSKVEQGTKRLRLSSVERSQDQMASQLLSMEVGGSRGRSLALAPLWEGLPLELRMKILGKLPLQKLLHFRAVCSDWRNMIDSGQVLYEGPSGKPTVLYHHPGGLLQTGGGDSVPHLALPNSAKSTWERHVLPFTGCNWTATELESLIFLLASDGGLLCFSKKSTPNTFTIYNPLTKRWRYLIPASQVLSHISRRASLPRKFSIDGRAFWNILDTLLVGLVMNKESGSYKLVVAGIDREAGPETQIYDSAGNVWRRSTPLPLMSKTDSGYGSLYAERGISHAGCVYWHIYEDAWTDFHGLLKFNFELETWSFVNQSTPCDKSLHLQIVPYQRHVLLFEWATGVAEYSDDYITREVSDLLKLGPEIKLGDEGLRELIHFNGRMIPVGATDEDYAFPVGVISQGDTIFVVFRPIRRGHEFPLRIHVCGGRKWLPMYDLIRSLSSLSAFSPTLRAFV